MFPPCGEGAAGENHLKTGPGAKVLKMRNALEDWDHQKGPFVLIALIAVGLLCGVILTGFITRPARRPQRDLQSNSSSSSASRSK